MSDRQHLKALSSQSQQTFGIILAVICLPHAIKRRYGSAVGPSAWYRQFRELVLTATVYNLEQAIKE
jgi:hypothetical protein